MNAVAKSIDFADLDDAKILRGIADAKPVTLADAAAPIWPEPELCVLSAGRRTPPAMPPEMFGPLWPHLRDLAEGAGAPVDYVALGYLSVAASLIGGKRKARPYAGDWTEPCILWVSLVGDPSSNKSPALDRVINPLRDMEKDHAASHADNLLVHEGDAERAKAIRAAWQERIKEAVKLDENVPPMPAEAADPVPPKRRRLVVQDSTPEKMADILTGNPSGTLHFRDELAGWLSSFERYSGGGGREFWLEAYGGRPYVVDRKSNPEAITVPFNGVSVVGGIQPEKLAEALLGKSRPDDGFVARFLWAWPDRAPFSRARRAADPLMLANVYRNLDGLSWGIADDGSRCPVTLPLEDTAADLFEAFERENRDAGDEAAGLYKSFVGKLSGIVLRLALVVEYTRWAHSGGEEPRFISLGTIAAVTDFVDSYAKPTALRVFGDAARSEVERDAAVIARHIVKMKRNRGNERELRRNGGLAIPREATQRWSDAFGWLKEAGWLRETPHREGNSTGRHSSDFEVNPKVLGGGDG